MKEKFFLFWSGPLSQWHLSTFNDGMNEYNCAEQYMMFQKALHFKDYESADAIMQAKDPRRQKRLGRQVKNFNEKRWNEIAREVVYFGNLLKFTQNKDLLFYLVNCTETIVEASPVDKIWGIGLDAANPDCLDRSKWLGKNWLGQVLTKVRDNMMINF